MALPFCHSRRALAGQDNLFFCAHPRVHAKGSLVTESICRLCSYWQQPPPRVFRSLSAEGVAVHGVLCVHFGEFLGLRECQGCKGSVQVKAFACSHPQHPETTLRDCETCPDYQQKPLKVVDGEG